MRAMAAGAPSPCKQSLAPTLRAGLKKGVGIFARSKAGLVCKGGPLQQTDLALCFEH